MSWRQGSKVKLNVYDGDRPVCQCHNEEDARLMVAGSEALRALNVLVHRIATVQHRDPGIWDAFRDAVPDPISFCAAIARGESILSDLPNSKGGGE